MAARRLETLLRGGADLHSMPWLLERRRQDVALLKGWLKGFWAQQGPGATPCGTDLLAYLPFDPTEQSAAEYLEATRPANRARPGIRAVGPNRGSTTPQVAREKGQRTAWLRRGQRPNEGPNPTIRLPKGGTGTGAGAAWDAGRPELSCAVVQARLGAKSAPNPDPGLRLLGDAHGALIVDPARPGRDRPVIPILCDYLRAWWQELLERGVTDRNEALAIHPAFPFRTQYGAPHEPELVEGWPPGHGLAPAQPLPGGRLTRPADRGHWLRFNRNIFVLRRVPDGGGGWSLSFGCSAAEATFIGLSLEILARSLPAWATWQAAATTRRFDLSLTGSGGTHHSLLPVWEACFVGSHSTSPPLYVFTPRHVEGNDAQGRAHPADHAISLATTSSRWTDVWDDGVSALRDLRRDAFDYLMSAGGTLGSITSLASALAREAELILHESGHTLAFTEIAGAATGISGEWYAGRSNGPADRDIRGYLFPNDRSERQSSHNALTVGAKWFQCLLEQNRTARDRMATAACKCTGAAGRGAARKYPRYGGWGRDDDICWSDPQIGRFDNDNETCR